MSIDIPLLARICEAPGAPGSEKEIRKLVLAELKGLADDISIDNMGNVIALKKGKSSAKRSMAAAHMGGNGALVRQDGSIQDFYQTGGLSYGLQAGVQKYGYALFLMDREAFVNINRAEGWEVGSSPSLVIVDKGKSSSLSTTTIDSGTYAFFFNQTGLMGGLGLQGSKITRIHPGR